ncbi:probable cytochrome P450 6a13 [Malaya genurostris]|uniref:probable cytochrome P450 6a13 n=1 Tax=Malaya genurostris TaxID=325434 RepID=UPI0026F3FEFA|nr:probable cytochrome P450 6a13 [Malaya genurostris]
MAIALVIISLLVTFLLVGVVYVKHQYTYWKRKRVPFSEPEFPYGNFKHINRQSLASFSTKHYRRWMGTGSRFFGLFLFVEPQLFITDPDLIKTVLIKDFNYFPERGIFHNVRDDPLSAHLFSIDANEWRSLRARLTPTFTSGKMKQMFSTLGAVGEKLSQFLTKEVGSGKDVQIKDTMARFTIDVIGSCAFGIECNSLKEPDSEFRKFGKLVFEKPRHSVLIIFFLKLYPEAAKTLRLKLLRSECSEFFYKIVKNTVEYREKNSVERNDFLNLLIQLKNDGKQLSMNEIAAQSFIFFGAGFETSSSNQTFCLYELALNQDCQEKARNCVLEAMKKHGGMTYEAVCEMSYLDHCINETLRLYPSLAILERRAFKDYQIPDSDVVVPKGMKIYIPAFAIHRDERYYPNPDVFDPDRFRPEESAKRHIGTFLPFGEGPRICIGLRFGMLQSRVGLATILSQFKVGPSARTPVPIEFSGDTTVLRPKGDLWLKFEPL